MRIQTAILFAGAMLLSLGAADTASAGKEVFHRTKPHVNVGTISRSYGPSFSRHLRHGTTSSGQRSAPRSAPRPGRFIYVRPHRR